MQVGGKVWRLNSEDNAWCEAGSKEGVVTMMLRKHFTRDIGLFELALVIIGVIMALSALGVL